MPKSEMVKYLAKVVKHGSLSSGIIINFKERPAGLENILSLKHLSELLVAGKRCKKPKVVKFALSGMKMHKDVDVWLEAYVEIVRQYDIGEIDKKVLKAFEDRFGKVLAENEIKSAE